MKNEKKSKRVGRPPGASDALPMQKIYNLLPVDGSRKRYVEIREEVEKIGMGFDTLQKYLSILEKKQQIMREVDATSRPPGVYYRRVTPDIFPLGKSFYELAVGDIQEVMEEIFRYDDEEELKEDLILFLKIEFVAIIFLLAKTVQHAISKEKPDEAIEYINLISRLHIEPWLHGLALICWGTKNVSPEAIDNINNFFAGIADSEFKKWLELTQPEHKQKLMEIIQKQEK